MRKLMWKFATKNFTVSWIIEDDDLNTDFMEKALAAKCQRKVADGSWECFQSEVQVKHNATGLVLGAAYLGNSIYPNPATFRDHFNMTRKGHGSYFADMVSEAISEARTRFPKVQAAVNSGTLKLKETKLAID